MSENDSTTTAGAPAAKRGRGGLRVGLVLAGALVGGAIGGTGGFALADGGQWHHGPRLERIQGMVRRALDGVGASSTQEAKVHDVVATAFAAMTQDNDREAMRKQMIDLLRAPTIDRAAVEKLRTDSVAKFDAKSKTFVTAVLDAADQLSPEQRTQLADRADAMMERHGGMGMRGRWGGHRERMDGHGPDGSSRPPGQGPDDGPDKG